MFEVSLSPLVQRQIQEIAGNHHQVAVEPGQVIRATKTWKNIGAAGTRDVVALYGTGTTIDDFVAEFMGSLVAVPAAAGEQVTTNVDCTVPRDATLGLKNALVGVGFYNVPMGEIFFDDYDIVVNAIEVKWVGPVGVQVSVSFVAQ